MNENEIAKLKMEIAELRSLIMKNDFSSVYINDKTNVFGKDIRFMSQTATPPGTPTSAIEARVYLKSNKLVIQYNDAGTVRYKYLDLTGIGVTWTHTTTAP